MKDYNKRKLSGYKSGKHNHRTYNHSRNFDTLKKNLEDISHQRRELAELVALLGLYTNYLHLRATIETAQAEGRLDLAESFSNTAKGMLLHLIAPKVEMINERSDIFKASAIEQSLKSLDTEDNTDFEAFMGVNEVNHKGEESSDCDDCSGCSDKDDIVEEVLKDLVNKTGGRLAVVKISGNDFEEVKNNFKEQMDELFGGNK